MFCSWNRCLFPHGDDTVTMIDDRTDVWNGAPNLVVVKPYTFFDGTTDINAPPGAELSNVCPTSVDRRVNTTKRRARVVRVPVMGATKNPRVEQGAVSESNKSSGIETYKEMVEWEDTDNHLIHLEDILKRIHSEYFETHDRDLATSDIPDLKIIVPSVRRKVLNGINVIFSGICLSNESPVTVWASKTARSLGAIIQNNFIPPGSDASTSHVIAGRPDTEKVYRASKHKTVHIVSPHWLQACSDQWKRADDHLYAVEYLLPVVKPLKPRNDTNPRPNEDTTNTQEYKKQNHFPRKRELSEDSNNINSDAGKVKSSKRAKL